jgi:fructose-bisphosphate aldolase class II
MITTGKEILDKARKEKYGVGAYNFVDMEILQSIIQAANEEKAPLIIQISEGGLKYMTDDFVRCFISVIETETKVPTAIHLDHGTSFVTVKKCIDLGFTSVMIDASHETFEKNIEITKQVAAYAHGKKVSVEAEIGTIGGTEENISAKHIIYSDPSQAEEFVKRTGIDYLAVAIGTSHGAYKFEGKTELNYSVLDDIAKRLSIPLVLHGASSIPKEIVDKINRYGGEIKNAHGVTDDSIKKAISKGICKINTDSDLRLIWTATVREVLATKPDEFDVRNIVGPARDNLIKYLVQRMRTLGTSGKA